MMNDGQVLKAAIFANPDDDAPRDAYADWLQEQGRDDEAELVKYPHALRWTLGDEYFDVPFPRWEGDEYFDVPFPRWEYDFHGMWLRADTHGEPKKLAKTLRRIHKINGGWLKNFAREVRFRRGFAEWADLRSLGYATELHRRLIAAHPIKTLILHGDQFIAYCDAIAKTTVREIYLKTFSPSVVRLDDYNGHSGTVFLGGISWNNVRMTAGQAVSMDGKTYLRAVVEQYYPRLKLMN